MSTKTGLFVNKNHNLQKKTFPNFLVEHFTQAACKKVAFNFNNKNDFTEATVVGRIILVIISLFSAIYYYSDTQVSGLR